MITAWTRPRRISNAAPGVGALSWIIHQPKGARPRLLEPRRVHPVRIDGVHASAGPGATAPVAGWGATATMGHVDQSS